jgi:predicted DNA-binding transcriptional regulator YafY
MGSRSTGAKRAFRDIERRRVLILTVREHPNWTHQELADHLGCGRDTVTRDLQEITKDLQKMNTEAFQVHWQRVQMEIQANKMLCLEMLRESRAAKKGSGSRWLEEMTKLMALEVKLLGLDKFDPNLGADRASFDKHERDAAVDAALKAYEIGKKSVSNQMVEEANRKPSGAGDLPPQPDGSPLDLVPEIGHA